MIELLEFSFMQRAILAALLVSAISGVIGSLVVINRMSFIAGGVAHGAYGGVGLAIFLGFSPLLGAACFALALGLSIAFLTQNDKRGLDATIGAMWAFGMAFGIILLDITPGYRSDLISYLFGSILAVSNDDLKFILSTLVLALIFVVLFYRQIVAVSFDAQFARLRGVKSALIYYVIVTLVCLSVVAMIRVVGLILVIALLTMPPFIAQSFSSRLGDMMTLSTLLATIFCAIGLCFSVAYNLTSGASIIAVASVSFFVVSLFRKYSTS